MIGPKCRRDSIRPPLSASSHHPLQRLLSLEGRTSLSHGPRQLSLSLDPFPVIGPFLWNLLQPSARAYILSSNLSTSLFLLKIESKALLWA